MRCTIRDISFGMLDATTRLPFRFGISTMTEAPILTCRVRIETGSGQGEGFSADLLVPKWFEKNPESTIASDQDALIESALAAATVALEGDEATPFDHWWRWMDAIPDHGPALVRGFGIALVERALIDATCRLAGVPFAESATMLGFEAGRVDDALDGIDPLGRPSTSIAVRHTVGLLDAIRDDQVTTSPNDGLPVSLEENIRVYGLHWFKLKVCGDHDADVERLSQILDVLPSDARITLDGNEQFQCVGDVRRMIEGLDDTRRMSLTSRLVLIEQPLARASSFDRDRLEGIEGLPAPVIIDEADGT
ncbi:MAG: hypothetical protein KDA28_01370, partial [Phycisphaerales bacterium]|nr:hypothetical protein [Phycisphaerales bacterium]